MLNLFRVKTLSILVVGAVALTVAAPQSASADVVVTLSDSMIQAGGTTTMDVTVSSDSVLPEGFNLFSLDFLISPTSASPGTSLQFVSPQSEAYLMDSDYLFFGDSSSAVNGFSATATATTNTPSDTLFLSDATDSGNDALFVAPRLIGRLELLHQIPMGTSGQSVAGDLFSIAVTGGFFEDASMSQVVFSSNSASVVVTAVPEPSAIILSMTALLGYFFRRRVGLRFGRAGAA